MSFLSHIRACNRHRPERFIPFCIDGRQVGRVLPEFAGKLAAWPGLFRVSAAGVELAPGPGDIEERSARVARVLEALVQRSVISHLHGEQYAATPGTREEALLLIDRAAAPYFGIRAFGQHVNGYVRDGDGLKMWLGRRAMDRLHYPGHLDNLAAGGLPYGISLQENLVKECWEEAGISRDLALQSVPVGEINYHADTKNGFKPDTLYCYDLELPADFRPVCNDGEVAEFLLWPVEQVMETVAMTSQFKLNCNLVVIDFLMRHEYITPEEGDYPALVSGLHPGLPALAGECRDVN
jgi:8-oxo-dGTP pyrophosphatase MutT (NUDIX family)